MELPFSTDQFLEIFRSYNEAIWPAQIFAYLLGTVAVVLAIWPIATRAVAGILAVFWIFMGTAYHILFFSAINPAAVVFGGFFVLQGLFFLSAALWKPLLSVRYRNDAYGMVGAGLILYAMVVYPALGALAGHGYPYAPVFGVAPCPTTIFTFGLLLWTEGRVPIWLPVIPALWAIIGTSAAVSLRVPEDFGLLVAAVVATVLLAHRNRRLVASVSYR